MDRNRKLPRTAAPDDHHEELRCRPRDGPVLSQSRWSSGVEQEEQDGSAVQPSDTDSDDSDSSGEGLGDGGVRVYRCIQCDQSFTSWQQLELHARRHVGEQRLRCHLCNRRFRLEAQLKHHLNKHLAQKPYACTHCGKTFLQKGSLRYHQLIHAGTKPYSCSRCGRRFRSKSQRKVHMCAADTKKLRKTKKLRCAECGEMFANRLLLMVHERVHQGKELYTCSFCGVQLLFRSCLEKHVRGHTGERPFSCAACHKRFRWASQIKNHKCAPPLDPRKHPCSECSAAFPTKAQLLVHLRGHQGKKLYTCSICGMQRRFKSQLDIHMRSHTREKPYSCSVCKKRFAQLGTARQHQLAHAQEKPFSCSDCGRSFTWRFQIKKHRCQARASGRCGSHVFRKDSTQTSQTPPEPADGESWRQTQQVRSRFTYQRKKEPVCEGGRSRNPDRHVTLETCTKSRPPQSVDSQLQTRTGLGESGSPIQRNSIRWFRPEGAWKHPEVNHQAGSTSEGHLIKEEPLGSKISHGGPPGAIPVKTEDRPELSCEHAAELWTGGGSGCSEEQTPAPRCLRPTSPPRFAFGCSLCHHSFGSREELSVHAASHVSCSVCNSTFTGTEALIQHMRSHAKQTRFSCSVCRKDFAWRRHLTKHMEVHTNEGLQQAQRTQRTQRSKALSRAKLNQDHNHRDPAAGRSAAPCKAAGPGSGAPRQQDSMDSDFWTGRRTPPADSPLGTGALREVKQESEEEPSPSQIKEEPLEAEISQSSSSPVRLMGDCHRPPAAVLVKSEEDVKPVCALLLHHTDSGTRPGPGEGLEAAPSDSSETDVSDEDWMDWRGTRLAGCNEVKAAEREDSVDSDFWKDER